MHPGLERATTQVGAAWNRTIEEEGVALFAEGKITAEVHPIAGVAEKHRLDCRKRVGLGSKVNAGVLEAFLDGLTFSRNDVTRHIGSLETWGDRSSLLVAETNVDEIRGN